MRGGVRGGVRGAVREAAQGKAGSIGSAKSDHG